MKAEPGVIVFSILSILGASLVAFATIPPDTALHNLDGWVRLVGLPGLGNGAALALAILLAINAIIIGLFVSWLRPRLQAEAARELWEAMERNIREPRPAPGSSWS